MSGGLPSVETANARRRRDTLVGHTVVAQSINDKSYMESMVNFFQDISQVYANTSQTEEKEIILWTRFIEYNSILDPVSCSQLDSGRNDVLDSLMLLIGYKNGIQMWNICENGDMQEVLSLRQGPVKTACIVPSPSSKYDLSDDPHGISRPLLAVCLAADKKQLFTSISILSLRTEQQVELLKFDDNVEQIRAGLEGRLIVSVSKQLQVFDTFNFHLLFKISDCYLSPSNDCNPIAVDKNWLAYSPTKQMQSNQSAGGVEDDGIYSYAATVISAAKTLKKGLVNLGETVNWLAKSSMIVGEEHLPTSIRELTGQRSRNLSGGSSTGPDVPDCVPGLVTVINMTKLDKKVDGDPAIVDSHTNGAIPTEAIVAHFPAHTNAIVCMEFSPCGSLLATADKSGHAFHVFSILPHPYSSKMGAVHHLYTLYRGDTSARVQDISFSSDCRWISISTLRGTSHIYPIASYGGVATVRTHVSHRVVNRSSRFHKSAGLEDMDPASVNMGPGHHSNADSPNSIAHVHARRSRTYSHGSRGVNSSNPRLSPHPQPTLVNPLTQIRTHGTISSSHTLGISTMTGQLTHGTKSDKSSSAVWPADTVVASIFTCGHLKICRSVSNHDTTMRRVPISSSSNGGQCLLVVSSNGFLTEHHLEARPHLSVAKVSDDSPIDLISAVRFQWHFQRLLLWGEVTLPLLSTNSLLVVDNRRRERVTPELTSSNTSALNASNSSTETGVFITEHNRYDHNKSFDIMKTLPDDDGSVVIPKTQQPMSRNLNFKPQQENRAFDKPMPSSLYPGTAVAHQKIQRKSRSMDVVDITPHYMNNDDLADKRSSPALRDQTSFERVNGQFYSDHHNHDLHDQRPSSAESIKSQGSIGAEYDEWLSQVEMVSHEGPARRLWMGPQFCFKMLQSTGSTMLLSSASSALISNRSQIQIPPSSSPPSGQDNHLYVSSGGSNHDLYVDEMDLHSLKIQTNRSDPMPTPKSGLPMDRYDVSSVTIESGSGNFDRHSRMLEIGAYGSLEDRRFVTPDDGKLRERIADAMHEQYNEFLSGGGINRDIRTKSDSSDACEFPTTDSDGLISAGQFEFDSENPSLELPTDS